MFNDFKRVIIDGGTDNVNLPVTGGKYVKDTSSTDWKLNCKQQIGIYVDKNYGFLEKGFAEAGKQ